MAALCGRSGYRERVRLVEGSGSVALADVGVSLWLSGLARKLTYARTMARNSPGPKDHQVKEKVPGSNPGVGSTLISSDSLSSLNRDPSQPEPTDFVARLHARARRSARVARSDALR